MIYDAVWCCWSCAGNLKPEESYLFGKLIGLSINFGVDAPGWRF
jgi:hypothetical protein